MRRTSSTLAASALLVALTLSGCSTPAPPAEAVPTPTPSMTTAAPKPTPVVDVPVTSSKIQPVVAVNPPVEVRIDGISIDVPIVPAGLDEFGQMELQVNPAIASWYRFGPTPSTGSGNTVLSAHIDYTGYPIGPFASLRDVPAGAEVVVSSEDGSEVRYAVESVTYYPKTDLPIDQLFDRTGDPALVLITCGGEFDSSTGHYRDNVVLVAKPA